MSQGIFLHVTVQNPFEQCYHFRPFTHNDLPVRLKSFPLNGLTKYDVWQWQRIIVFLRPPVESRPIAWRTQLTCIVSLSQSFVCLLFVGVITNSSTLGTLCRVWAKWRNGSKKIITKTPLYNFDPLQPHFYKAKMGFIGNGEAVLTSTHNVYFKQKYEKY